MGEVEAVMEANGPFYEKRGWDNLIREIREYGAKRKQDEWLRQREAQSLLRVHQVRSALKLCGLNAEPMTKAIMLQVLN